MIVGWKESIPYIVKSLLETDWLKDEILACIKMLFSFGFSVRMVVWDSPSSNVLAFNKLLATLDNNNDSLYVTIDMEKICLSFNTVHQMKNIRNN